MSDQDQRPFPFPPPQGGQVDVLIVAGEHSGDEHAARMVRELRTKQPDLAIAALGGPQLASAGAQVLHDLTASSVVGVFEVLKNYPFFRALFAETLRWIAGHRPRAVCLVDYPGLNLRLAAALRERGLSAKGGGKIKVLYYISPQIWAWKAGRRFAMARDLDAMAVIFPFEPKCYADTALPVEFVGHPFMAADYVSPVRYDLAGPVLLLPGSRRQAVGRIFPLLLAGLRAFGEREGVVLFPSDDILDALRAAGPPANVKLLPVVERRGRVAGGFGRPIAGGWGAHQAVGGTGPTTSVTASAVLTSSGTMSMHCALAGIPGAIAYRANPLTYVLGRMLVQVESLGIANLLLREPMYPEFIQGAAIPEALAAELHACIHDWTRRARTLAQAERLQALLSVPASGTAADWLARQLADGR
ncbi:MAG: lipid-A-disaccharide synthase [Verrucomicrobia bacterium]|nr:lipid-A-disaccharide synthase [Verrucomicrobiota bacterium]